MPGRLIIKIATWNVNSIKARMPIVTDWLRTRQPDVLMLQELKGLEFPAEEFQALGYYSSAVTQKTYNGVAILSREPQETVCTTLFGDEDDSHARFLEVRIAGMRFADIYLPNGNPIGTPKFDYKMAWMDRFHQQMRIWLKDGIPTVVGGDYNVIPEEIDCSKPETWTKDALFQPETRQKFRELKELGYVDAFRALYPNVEGAYTYWDYFRDAFTRNRGIRIDHFLLSPGVAERLVACEVDKEPRTREKPSDHTPVVLTLS